MFLCLLGSQCCVLLNICTDQIFMQRMQPQATGFEVSLWKYNMSVHPSLRPLSTRMRSFCGFWYFYSIMLVLYMVTITITITSVGVQCHNTFSLRWGPENPSGVHLRLYVCLPVCMSTYLSICSFVCISVSLFVCPRRFLAIKTCGP